VTVPIKRLTFYLLLCSWSTAARDFENNNKPVFDVRLQSPLSSVTSTRGTAVTALVVSPGVVDGRVYLPVGSKIVGEVARRTKIGIGLIRERALLDVRFSELELPGGDRHRLKASVFTIDNAREEVTPRGQIKGILAADSLPSYIFGVWYRPTMALPHRALLGLTGASGMTWTSLAPNPYGAAAILGLRYALVPWPNPEILLPAGTEIRLRLDSLADGTPSFLVGPGFLLDEDLNNDLNARPFRLAKSSSESPSDIVNIAMIGTGAQITTAFQTAGWQPADSWDRRAVSDGLRAFTRAQGYPTAPVSELKYEGELPTLVFQKSFNTIMKRHHIRVWNAGSFNDRGLWLGAATHDIGVEFDKSKVYFTHRIDPRIDLERTKIINDLVFCGCLERVAYVERPAAATDSKTMRTDGRLAVLFLQDCAPVQTFPDAVAGDRPPGVAFRMTQRTLLETRNYLLRRNAYYQSYRAIKGAIASSRRSSNRVQEAKAQSIHANLPLGLDVAQPALAEGVELEAKVIPGDGSPAPLRPAVPERIAK
jgi:hypothetical protein